MKVSLERYIVKPDGQILDKQKNNQPIKTFKSNKYLQCCIYDENGKHIMCVHNVVAQALLDNWFEGCVVHHKDNNQHNNNVTNLECLQLEKHSQIHSQKYFDKITVCPCCKKEFLWTHLAQSHFARAHCKNGPFCSRKCSAKYTYKYTETMRTHNVFPKRKPEEYWNSKAVRCIEKDIIFPSAGEASRQLNISSSFIRKVANNGNSAFGLHFEFI